MKRFLNDEKNDGECRLKFLVCVNWRIFNNPSTSSIFNRPAHWGPLYSRRQSDWLFNSQIPDQGGTIHPNRGGRM